VQNALYNLGEDALVPGHQLAFDAFNYGDLSALSFSATLPWVCLDRAAKLRGWRPRSLALLRAVMRAGGLPKPKRAPRQRG
jgi:hypothetical protein